jgi:Phosphatidylserine synthase
MIKKESFIIRLNWVDCLTLTGLVLSSLSIGFSISGKFSFALSVLFLAMLVDAFDGIMARKFGTERNFGRYLDGFIDVYDYLAAPTVFLYCWGFNSWYYVAVLMVFMISGVVRLSVFNETGNIEDEEAGLSYLGMPVFWSVLFLGFLYSFSWLINKAFLMPVIAVIFAVYAFLMVYNRRFHKFKSWKVMLAVLLSFALLFCLDGFGIINRGFLQQASVLSVYDHAVTAMLVVISAAVGGVLHMIAVKKDWLPFLKIPVSRRLFGENKTIRGFILMPLFSLPGAYLAYQLLGGYGRLTISISETPWFVFGLLVGFVYVLFELPNSFVKRRMGIAPGDTPNKGRFLMMMVDNFDSSIGGGVLLYGCFNAPVQTALAVVVLGPLVAVVIKRFLYLLKLKKKYS